MNSKSDTSSSTSKLDGSWESFALKLIKQAHADVDEIRAKAGLKPWDWTKVPKPSSHPIFYAKKNYRMIPKRLAHLLRLQADAARRKEIRSGKKESRARAAANGSD